MGDANLSQQLDGVQENTIECMKIAADVMDTLANGKESDPSFKANCEKFMERVAASQVTQLHQSRFRRFNIQSLLCTPDIRQFIYI